jgi:hypothetical protein
VLGARVLAEFGDDKRRYADAKARKNYAGPARSPASPANAHSSSLAESTTTDSSMRLAYKPSAH